MRRLSLTVAVAAATVGAGAVAGAAGAASTARPTTKDHGGIEVRQAGGTTEPVIATFKRAKCDRFGGGFVALAKANHGTYRLTVDISAESWEGWGHHYLLFRRRGPLESLVKISAPGGTVYDSTVPVPGAPGAGGIAFTPKGTAISVGGLFFLEDDMEVGVVVTGAMSCTYKRKPRG
jgi:hypothetical protein